MAMARGLLMPSPLPLLRPSLRLMPTTATVDTALAMVVTATARGLLMLTTAMAVMAHTAMARGPLMPMPTTAMAVMAHTAMARGLLMPSPLPLLRLSLRLMPTTAGVDTALAMVVTATARGPLMPMLTTAMAAMAHTAMARGPLMPMPTTAMAATAHMAIARGLLMP